MNTLKPTSIENRSQVAGLRTRNRQPTPLEIEFTIRVANYAARGLL